MTPIVSARALAYRLGTTATRLREICRDLDRHKDSHYQFWTEQNPKNPFKFREIKAPRQELKAIQRAIARLLADFPLSDSAHGGVRNRSPRSNASKHLGKPWVITMDVKGFFPSVRHYEVAKLFRKELNCGHEVAWLLTRLTTLGAELPQGAPSSTAVANVLLTTSVDGPITKMAAEAGVANTRFVDDIAFSGDDPRPLINATARALSRRRLSIHRSKSKLRIMPRHGRQKVTGLVVNSKSGASVPKSYRDAVRASIFRLNALTEGERAGQIDSIRGKIAYIRHCNPGSAKRLELQLAAALGPDV
jgi:RNA-directed DNA polymerase